MHRMLLGLLRHKLCDKGVAECFIFPPAFPYITPNLYCEIDSDFSESHLTTHDGKKANNKKESEYLFILISSIK